MIKKIFLLLAIFGIASCAFVKTPPKDKIILRKIDFEDLNGWKNDDLTKIVTPFERSCEKIKQQQNKKYIDYSKIKIKTKDYVDICNNFEQIEKKQDDIRLFLRQHFSPYEIIVFGKKKGVFTGYYEAELFGSKEKTKEFNVPIYGTPKDLVSLNPSEIDDRCCNKTILGRITKDKRIKKYFSRKQIENNKNIKAPVLLWVNNPVDAFILHIQGSGRVIMRDGSVVRIGYASNNGHDFVGIGGLMKSLKLNEKEGYSMPAVRKWLEENPKKAKELMNLNPRFIFFRIIEQENGPIGAQGVALTPHRSIAVDRKYIPLGLFLWIDTKGPDGENLQKLALAQDMGAAIKGVIRADYFWGYGKKAFNKAGRMKSFGKYYILMPKKK